MVAPRQDPLDERLLQGALEQLADGGLETLTLRSLARRTGVSHGAPLRHFRSLADLRSEVAARGFRRLSHAIERSSAELPPGAGPVARLAAAGRAYVLIAVDSPGLFALMFRPESLELENEHYRHESSGAFEELARLVRAAQDAGWHEARDSRLLAGTVWAAVHGLATLWAGGAFSGPIPDASLDDALTTTLELVLGDQRGATP